MSANELSESFTAALVADPVSLAGQLNSLAAAVNDHSQDDIPARLPKAVTETGATRALDSVFVVDANNPALVFYCVELSVTAPLLSTQEVTVDLLRDAANPPTTSRGQAHLKGEQLAGLSLVSIAVTTRQTLTAFVPAGHRVKLALSGAGSATLVSATEIVFG